MAKRRKSRSGQIAVPAPPNESESIRVSKITNGYLIAKSGTKRGRYFEHVEYSAGRPVVSAAGVPTKGAAPRKAKPKASRKRSHVDREVGYLGGR